MANMYESNIYNGGGSGSLKNVGELEDNDFIVVENNTISNYTNSNRSVINFICNVKNDDSLNFAIYIETSVNATINLYKVVNGVYYPIAYTNNAINANEDYILYALANSIYLDKLNNYGANPEYAKVGNLGIYKVCKIGNLLFLAEDIDDNYKSYNEFLAIINNVGDGWRSISQNDVNYLNNTYGLPIVAQMKSTSGWDAGQGQGTNETGYNALPKGQYFTPSASVDYMGIYSATWIELNDINRNAIWIGSNNSPIDTTWSNPNSYKLPVRLVKDI